jgi:chemotaxis protein MotB
MMESPQADETELVLRQGGGLGRLIPWLLAAGAAGFGGYLYGMVYRPLREESGRRAVELREAQAQARDARREVEEKTAELDKVQKEAADVRKELATTSTAKEENDKLLAKLQKETAQSGVEVASQAGRITLTLVDKILFASGEADLTEPGEQLLRRLGAVLKEAGGSKLIQVNGHTDNVPIRTDLKDLYPTNWDLSAARAINVVRFLSDEVGVDPRRLMAAGFGPYRPVASNGNTAGRARNRRIEILLLPADIRVVKGDFADAKADAAAEAEAKKPHPPRPHDRDRLRAVAAQRAKATARHHK